MNTNRDIQIVFLTWFPDGIEKFNLFFQSYLNFYSGYPHKLTIIFKDFENEKSAEPYHDFLKENNITYSILHFNKGFDIDAYFYTAKNVSGDLLFFINTNSIILYNNWLLKMYNNIIKENVSMVSASGSWQSYSSLGTMRFTLKYEISKGFRHNFRKYKLLIKSLFYYRLFFEGFPNPHLRTNAFMIWKETFLQIGYKPITSKFRAYRFESGRGNITKQILKKNKKVLVVDKFGNGFGPEKWYNSKTFWSFDQENLLVSDNQTRKYEVADNEHKKLYTYLAWGKR